MRAIIVDDEKFCIDYLEQLCEEAGDVEICGKFQDILQAVGYLAGHRAELAFLDIEMPGINGIQAADSLRQYNPNLNIIYITGYEQYALDAFKKDAVDYLLKPCSPKELRKALDKAKKLSAGVLKPRVQIQTFGHFAVYVDGIPCRFTNRKAKELLALMVDFRGAEVSIEQAVSVLWEDRPYDETVKQLYRKAIVYLRQFMKEYNLDFIDISRGRCHVIPSRIICDYYQFLEGDEQAVKSFGGEYMGEYSWAEMTLARLERLMGRSDI